MTTEDVAAMLIDQATDAFAVTGLTPSEMVARISELQRKLDDTKALTSIIIKERDAAEARVKELEATAPPEGYPSWEDWLAQEHLITFDYSYARSAWTFFIDREGSGQFFPDYPTAIEAAKKEAGR